MNRVAPSNSSESASLPRSARANDPPRPVVDEHGPVAARVLRLVDVNDVRALVDITAPHRERNQVTSLDADVLDKLGRAFGVEPSSLIVRCRDSD